MLVCYIIDRNGINHTAILRTGNLVMVMSRNSNPGDWPLGLVIDMVVSNDGLVREVTVKTSKGILRRGCGLLKVTSFSYFVKLVISSFNLVIVSYYSRLVEFSVNNFLFNK